MSQIKGFLGSTVGLITCLVAAALGVYLLVFHLAHVVARRALPRPDVALYVLAFSNWPALAKS
jgi:hypothetical protein